jgi:2-isopropylmalate synthase
MTQEQNGMFGAAGTGDTSGYGGLVRTAAATGSTERPYGGYFDDVADDLERAYPDFADAITRVVEQVKDLEAHGWSFEAADASFELLLQDALAGKSTKKFTVESWRTIDEQREDGQIVSEATVKVHADGQRIVATGEGNGPVNALDNALRSALVQHFPQIAELDLVDYKVRILDGGLGTGAVTRVLIETAEKGRRWTTVGVSENVIAASWLALEDAISYGLLGKAN